MDKNKERDCLPYVEPWYYGSGPRSAGLLIILLTLIIYLPAVNAPFVLDDEVNVSTNTLLRDFANFWPPTGSRYLAHLSFAINYKLGGLSTSGYHLINMLIHILSGLTLYGLVRTIFAAPAMRCKGKDDERALGNHIALVTAVIFIAHPLNTQAVIYITQRFTLLASLLYLLSLYLYLKYRVNVRNGQEGEGRPYSPILYGLSILAALGAAKTKEISFTLPFVIILSEYMFFTEPGRWISRRRLILLLPYTLVLIIIPLAIFAPELGLWDSGAVVGNSLTRAQQILDLKELSPYTYLMTQFTVVPTYIKLFFLPISLNLDYDYPLYHSFFNLRVLAGFALLLFIFVASLVTLSFARRKNKPLLLLATAGMLWFFITLSMESTVLPIRDVIFEHRMYLPGAGMAAALAVVIVHFLSRLKKRSHGNPGRTVLITALIITTPLTALALGRALVWSDGIRLYEDIVRKSPEKARNHNNLGALYLEKGELNMAIVEFRKTIALDSSLTTPYKNLARALYKKGDINGSVEALQDALRVYSGDFEAHGALASIYRDEGLFEKSEKEYKIVISLVPSSVDARRNLAKIYLTQGRFIEAAAQYKKILLTRPDKIVVYYNLGFALEKSGSINEALYNYRKFIALAPASLRELREKVIGHVGQLSQEER